jgi:SAM-dependent methyltransferase
MSWKLHVAKLAIFGRIPFGNAIRRIKRRLFGYPPDPENLRGTLRNLDEMERAIASVGRSFSGATVLEIGSGWFPTIPIMLSLRGARRIFLTDLTPHLDEITFSSTLDFLKPQISEFPDALCKKTIEEFNLEYLAPFCVDEIPDGIIDFIISRTVLEHIPPCDISRLLRQLHSKLSPNGLMVHYIDHSDHLEHRDKSISKINFLTWSAKKHGMINWLTKEGENRLRHHEYRDLFEESGYDIISESAQAHQPTCELAKVLPLKERFAKMTPEQVSILSSIYLLAPRNPPSGP